MKRRWVVVSGVLGFLAGVLALWSGPSVEQRRTQARQRILARSPLAPMASPSDSLHPDDQRRLDFAETNDPEDLEYREYLRATLVLERPLVDACGERLEPATGRCWLQHSLALGRYSRAYLQRALDAAELINDEEVAQDLVVVLGLNRLPPNHDAKLVQAWGKTLARHAPFLQRQVLRAAEAVGPKSTMFEPLNIAGGRWACWVDGPEFVVCAP